MDALVEFGERQTRHFGRMGVRLYIFCVCQRDLSLVTSFESGSCHF
jgi:hypothetical protein